MFAGIECEAIANQSRYHYIICSRPRRIGKWLTSLNLLIVFGQKLRERNLFDPNH